VTILLFLLQSLCPVAPHSRRPRHIYLNPQQVTASGIFVMITLQLSPTSHIIKNTGGSRYVSHANSPQAMVLSSIGIQNHKHASVYRSYRGRGRGSRGGYSGNRPPNHNERPYFPPNPAEGWGRPSWDSAGPFTPAAAPPEPALTPVASPASGSYHSRGYPPPPQSPHASSLSHSHSHPTPSTHTRPYSHAHGNTNTRVHPHSTVPPTSSPVLATTAPLSSSSQPNSYRHATAHPPVHDRDHEFEHTRPRDHRQSQPPPPPPPRSQDWRQAPAPALAPQAAAADDGGYSETRHADSAYTVRSPTPSDRDEQVQWTPTPSDSVTAGGQRERRHHDGQNRAWSPSRSHVGRGHRHADEVRNGGWH